MEEMPQYFKNRKSLAEQHAMKASSACIFLNGGERELICETQYQKCLRESKEP
jgi:hypothetical protein